MARPKKNNVEYFPHTVTHGKKMSYIEKKYNNDGYATWFKILEELGSTDNHYLDLSDEVQLMFLSDKCLITEELLIDIINDLVRLKEFDAELWNDNKIIYCQKFIDSIQDAYNKRTNDCINRDELIQLLEGLGVRKPNKSIKKPSKSSQSGSKKPQSKVKETKEEERKEKEFNIFWSIYPIKTAKKDCLTKWHKLKDKDIEKILRTIKNFVAYKPFKDYTHPNPKTYLNQERWNDEIKVNGKVVKSEEETKDLVTFYWEHEGRSNKRTIKKEGSQTYFKNQAVGGYNAIIL